MRPVKQSRFLLWWRDTNAKLEALRLTPMAIGEAVRAYGIAPFVSIYSNT